MTATPTPAPAPDASYAELNGLRPIEATYVYVTDDGPWRAVYSGRAVEHSFATREAAWAYLIKRDEIASRGRNL